MNDINAQGTQSSHAQKKENVHGPSFADIKQLDRRTFLKMTGIAAGTFAFAGMFGKIATSADAASVMTSVKPLDPHTIPKYVNQLIVPPIFARDSSGLIKVNISLSRQQILPLKDASGKSTGFGPTRVFTYGGLVGDPVNFKFSPGPTFEAVKGVPTKVQWTNSLTNVHFLPVDPTIHWANPNKMATPVKPFNAFPPGYPKAQFPIPTVTHLHGGETPSAFDGGPDSWFTYNGITGPGFVTRTYEYPNQQEATTLFYHDHALGATRLNLCAGLAGFYLIRDPKDKIAPLLPQGKYEVPIAIQDRMFFQKDSSGNNDLAFPYVGINPAIHPYWFPEFFGDTIMINGQVWPNLNVDRGQYRFRIVNGSNARFYTLFFSNGMSFVQIGSDGGYLKSAVKLTKLTLGTGERADILVDFSNIAPGTKIILKNNAPGPFPTGTPADPNTVGQIMQFTVGKNVGFKAKTLPSLLNPTLAGPSFPTLAQTKLKRVLTLNEYTNSLGPIALFLNGQMWDAPVSETPKVGTTEDWIFANTTMDTHPMHLHLIQFQLVNRQNFNAAKYLADWLKANKAGLTSGHLPLTKPTVVVPVEPYLSGNPTPPDPNECGWKDVIRANPGQVTRIRARFARQNGTPFGFDATGGPGYVWHCHIVDHEDNEMMRPMKLKH
jgi:spore coat protein A, manganese oxidase